MIESIRQKVAEGEFEFSQHAVDQSLRRYISLKDLREVIETAELIEDYSEDKYDPSCLLLGLTREGRPVHVHCTYPSRPLLKIITLYEPDPARWIDFRTRR